MQDFIVSYNKADANWALGIGDWLDQAVFTTILQAQDFGWDGICQMNFQVLSLAPF